MMKKSKIMLLIILSFVLTILLTTSVNANYQSVPTGNSKSATATEWITGIRQKESSGKGMGLNEEIDTTTGLATTKSNDIDVHLLKNTEYGAILILGSSDYGKQGTDITARRMDRGEISGTDVQASTTGNKYGIYEMGYYNMTVNYNGGHEWVAGGETTFLSGIASRYINKYMPSTTSARVGDATLETQKWHGSAQTSMVSGSSYGIVRGCDGAFSYAQSAMSNNYLAREGIVNGEGI